jgi:hypothetical protein
MDKYQWNLHMSQLFCFTDEFQSSAHLKSKTITAFNYTLSY